MRMALAMPIKIRSQIHNISNNNHKFFESLDVFTTMDFFYGFTVPHCTKKIKKTKKWQNTVKIFAKKLLIKKKSLMKS